MNGYGELHSWFCNSLEEAIAKELGIRPGGDGLLATYAEQRSAQSMPRDPSLKPNR
jgi:hypothetical protein